MVVPVALGRKEDTASASHLHLPLFLAGKRHQRFQTPLPRKLGVFFLHVWCQGPLRKDGCSSAPVPQRRRTLARRRSPAGEGASHSRPGSPPPPRRHGRSPSQSRPSPTPAPLRSPRGCRRSAAPGPAHLPAAAAAAACHKGPGDAAPSRDKRGAAPAARPEEAGRGLAAPAGSAPTAAFLLLRP